MNIKVVQLNGSLYIDLEPFLRELEDRDMLLLKTIAVPKLDTITTEGLRGKHTEIDSLIQQLKEIRDAIVT